MSEALKDLMELLAEEKIGPELSVNPLMQRKGIRALRAYLLELDKRLSRLEGLPDIKWYLKTLEDYERRHPEEPKSKQPEKPR